MNLYLFMGTNLPEIANCLNHLAGLDRPDGPTRLCIPDGLEQIFAPDQDCTLNTYPAGNASMDWLEDSPQRTFLLLDPRISPVPQLEALASRLVGLGEEPEKVVTIVDSQTAEQSPQLRSYLQACIYYSDVVLLGNRAGASKAFLRNYAKEYERNCYPCRFLLLKGKGIPEQALEILTPGVRRISQIFDLPEIEVVTQIDPLIEASCDLDMEEVEADPFRVADDSTTAPANIPDVRQWIVMEAG